MKEKDDIENLFSSIFAEEKVVPPAAVKSSVDAELFGGASSPNRLWILLPILLLFLSVGFYFHLESSEINEKQLVSDDILENNSEPNNVSSSSANSLKKNDVLYRVKNNTGNSNLDQLVVAEVVNKDFSASSLSLIGESSSVISSTGLESAESLPIENNYFIMDSGEVNSSINSKTASLLKKNIKQGVMSANESESAQNPSVEVLPEVNGVNVNSSSLLLSDLNESISSIGFVDTLSSKKASVIDDVIEPSIVSTSPVLKKNTSKFFEISLYNGLNHVSNQFSINFSDGRNLKESVGYQTSLEFSWGVSPKTRVATGFEFSQNSDLYSANVSKTISVLDSTYYDYITSIDSNGMEIVVDSALVSVYSNQTEKTANYLNVSQLAFSIPIYLKYKINLRNRLNLNISTGVLFSYLSQRTSLASSPIQLNYKKYGVSLMLRPELTYNWNHFGIGVYAKGMFDFSPGSTWNDASRNRLLIGGGVSLHYRF